MGGNLEAFGLWQHTWKKRTLDACSHLEFACHHAGLHGFLLVLDVVDLDAQQVCERMDDVDLTG